MSIATVVTRGYGSFGSVNYLPTWGYDIGAAAAIPETRRHTLYGTATTRHTLTATATTRHTLNGTATTRQTLSGATP